MLDFERTLMSRFVYDLTAINTSFHCGDGHSWARKFNLFLCGRSNCNTIISQKAFVAIHEVSVEFAPMGFTARSLYVTSPRHAVMSQLGAPFRHMTRLCHRYLT